MKRCTDKAAEDPAVEFDRFYEQGFDLVSSAKAQEAFDIHREDEKVREAYGRNDFGQRLLMARRLVEAGVNLVQVNLGNNETWDTHGNAFPHLKEKLLPPTDRGVSALLLGSETQKVLTHGTIPVLVVR